MARVRTIAWLALLTSAGLAAQQQPTFRSGTHTVSIYTTVVDATGRLVPGLTKDDFEVLDDDRPQPISVFSDATRPITIVIMLDRSGSMRANFNLERSAAVQFVTHLLPTDKARLGSFSTRIQIDPDTFTSDQDELIRILYENLQDPGPTPLWSATSVAMTALAHEDDRRVVLVLTDGIDNPTRPETSVPFEEVRDRSEAEEIMVYGIGLADECDGPSVSGFSGPSGWGVQGRIGIGHGGWRNPFGHAPGSASCTADKPDPHLRQLAMSSGGGYFELHGTDDLGPTFARVADELHRQYLLGFATTTFDGKVHRLDVRVRQPDLTARARRSYVAPAAR